MRYLQLYSQYLDLPSPNLKGFTSCRCPFHDDGMKRSDWSAGVDLQTGVFNCMKSDCPSKEGITNESGSLSPVMFVYKINKGQINFQEASIIIDEYRKEHKLIDKEKTFVVTKIINPRWKELAKKALETPLNTIEWVNEFAAARGIQTELMEKMGVGFLYAADTPPHWNRDSLVYIYRYAGDVVGIRYRDIEGNKSGEKNCFYTLWGIDDITDDTYAVIIVEGETDRLRTLQALESYPYKDKQIVVVSSPTGVFREEWVREIDAIPKKILIPQADSVGSKMVEQAEKCLGDALSVMNLH